MENFSYVPLVDSSRETRLINLQPADDTTKGISCDILHVSSEDLKNYEALSYTWGRPDHVEEILLNGKRALVRKNLYDALRHLRTSSTRKIWIDALCINQEDIEERNNQVKQMHHIYTKAEKVIIWLGLEHDNSGIALSFLRDIGQEEASGRYFLDSLQNSTPIQLEAVKRFFQRPYWNRLWIIQEVVLSQSATVYCGLDCVDWKHLFKFFFRLRNLPKRSLKETWLEFKDMIPSKLVQVQEKRQKSKTGASLRSVCSASVNSICYDPRDKIYGLLGLVMNTSNFDIQADYNKTLLQLLEEVIVIEYRRTKVEKDQSPYPSGLPLVQRDILAFIRELQQSFYLALRQKTRSELEEIREMIDCPMVEHGPVLEIGASHIGTIIKIHPLTGEYLGPRDDVFPIWSSRSYGIFKNIHNPDICQNDSDSLTDARTDTRRICDRGEELPFSSGIPPNFYQVEGTSIYQNCIIHPPCVGRAYDNNDDLYPPFPDDSPYGFTGSIPNEAIVGDQIWQVGEKDLRLYLVMRGDQPHVLIIGRASIPSYIDNLEDLRGWWRQPGEHCSLFLTPSMIKLLTQS